LLTLEAAMSRLHLQPLVLLACALILAGCAPQVTTSIPTPPAPTAPPPTALPATAAPAAVPTVAPTAVPTVAPTAAPTEAPTVAPTAAATAAATAAPTAAPTVALAPAPAAPAQILVLREGDLVALDVATGQESTLAEGVTGFAATPDGALLALTRGDGAAGEIWALRRATGELWRLTANERAESTLSWAPDGTALVYSSAPAPQPFPPDWQSWSEWCAGAEARLIELPASREPLAQSAERVLGAGCEPAFGPDGRRIVFATAPTGDAPGLPFTGANNALRMVNRQGENGWSLAIADGSGEAQGYLVYGPAWSPDAGHVGYQRFLGYQALVDINLVEAGSSYQRNGAPIGLGAGWMLPPRYGPTGGLVAVTEHNFSDARGFSGYDIWQTVVLRLGESSQMTLPSQELTLGAVEVERLRRATAAAWSPDGAALVVTLPLGWQPGLDANAPLFPGTGPGELWRWRPGAEPEAKLAEGVEFGSPLLWLPAAPGA
jgi:hypothetical protein